MSFASDLNKICKAAGDNAAEVIRRTAINLQNGMIDKSPVDTGRFRSNWQCGISAINSSTSDAPNSDAKGRTISVMETWKPGQTIFLTNSLPYAQRLEDGYSNQAPAGMVRLTVQAYATALKNAARSIK